MTKKKRGWRKDPWRLPRRIRYYKVFDALRPQAQQIAKEHALAQEARQNALIHGAEVGRILLEVKGGLPHGKFMLWVETQCHFSHATANNYMLLARNWETVQREFVTDTNLVLTEAVRWIRSRRQTRNDFERDYDALKARFHTLVGHASVNWTVDRLRTLLPRFDRSLAEDFKGELFRVRDQLDRAVAELDRFISGEIDEEERAHHRRQLALVGVDIDSGAPLDDARKATLLRELIADKATSWDDRAAAERELAYLARTSLDGEEPPPEAP